MVIDNGETTLVALDLLEALVAATQVDILAASRERLHVSVEMIVEVGGMDYQSGDGGDWRELVQSDAARPFIDRMRRFDHHFTVTDDNATHIQRICRTLSGIPLALEIASAWERALSCQEIAASIEEDFALLDR